jgi:hypothetical protein
MMVKFPPDSVADDPPKGSETFHSDELMELPLKSSDKRTVWAWVEINDPMKNNPAIDRYFMAPEARNLHYVSNIFFLT